ncbi:unnamed protein product, partial [Allacma fusca]
GNWKKNDSKKSKKRPREDEGEYFEEYDIPDELDDNINQEYVPGAAKRDAGNEEED